VGGEEALAVCRDVEDDDDAGDEVDDLKDEMK